ncbi:P1 family peptidase [Flavobacteriaceae bacterium GF1]
MKNNNCAALFAFLFVMSALGQDHPRARELGIPFNGTTGKYNNITDVPGVQVGYKTLIKGEGKLIEGEGPIRTGVTVIIPAGKEDRKAIPAGIFSFNGDGELTGSHFIEDYGFLPGAIIGITNTYSVGVVRDAIGEWQVKNFPRPDYVDFRFGLPIVGETYDGNFNDINGLHVTKEHVFEAIDTSKSGVIAEGNVGGGTGMWLYGFKGGTGSSSRVISIGAGNYTVGVLVQANFGHREDLVVTGVPVGKLITDLQPVFNQPKQDGSIIVVVATDAPILPIHLKQVAKRATNGIARTGAFGGNGSGDIFLAFSTAQPTFNEDLTMGSISALTKWSLDPIYKATVEATEEAIINALVAAKTLKGANDNIMYECPEDKLIELMKEYNRIDD